MDEIMAIGIRCKGRDGNLVQIRRLDWEKIQADILDDSLSVIRINGKAYPKEELAYIAAEDITIQFS